MTTYITEEAKLLEEINELPSLEARLQLIGEYLDSISAKINLHNYNLPNMLRETKYRKLWDEAIFVASKGIEFFPEDKKWYDYEIKIIELNKSGDIPGAIDTELERWINDGERSGAYKWAGDRFFEIGMHDKAWGHYNHASQLAVVEGFSPHAIRQSMAKLLIKEKRYSTAVEIVIAGICEAERLNDKGSPKSMIALLKRVLKLEGIYEEFMEMKVYETCKTKGLDAALSLIKQRRNT